MKNQIFNPFLPLWEYIPDGEPHVFGNRIYLFGSHDVEGGERYCAAGNYVGWSAPLEDISDWRCEGEIYNAAQDPRTDGEFCDLYAPDVVEGNDGRYYLYYSLIGGINSKKDDHNVPIGVAVCDTPCGRYQYLGFVRNPDGTPFLKYLPADPAVLNDNGTIRLYYGWAISMVASTAHGKRDAKGQKQEEAKAMRPDFRGMDAAAIRNFLADAEQMLFHRTREQLLADPEDVMGANHVVLADDMLTVLTEPARIVPSQFLAFGTSFEGHGFYEASSCRKIGDTYYFIYSDENSNMLSYATSKYPDRGFVFRGILQSNGDVGLKGRKGEDRLNMTANNHGSLEQINGQWYIFYHRHTHNSTYSRQACAEPVTILEDGSIVQAECTSCGLNGKALRADGIYSAVIACNLTNGKMPHATNRIVNADIPYITHQGNERFITNIKHNTMVGYKYIEFINPVRLVLVLRGEPMQITVYIGDNKIETVSFMGSKEWTDCSLHIDVRGTDALYLNFSGTGSADLLQFSFQKENAEMVAK